jgi:hypothetical protein
MIGSYYVPQPDLNSCAQVILLPQHLGVAGAKGIHHQAWLLEYILENSSVIQFSFVSNPRKTGYRVA